MSSSPAASGAPLEIGHGLEALLARAADDPSSLLDLPLIEEEDIQDRRVDRELRRRYANRWYRLAAAQLVILNVLLTFVGFEWMKYSDWLFHAYVVATFGEIAGILVIITRNLFPNRDKPA